METEDEVDVDGDVDMYRSMTGPCSRRHSPALSSSSQASGSGGSHLQAPDSDTASPTPERCHSLLAHTHRLSLSHTAHPHPRRAVGVVSDDPPAAGARVVINEGGDGVSVDGLGVGGGGVEDRIVSLEANDDFAMGAPPDAPGAIAVTVVNGHPHTGMMGIGGESEGESATETQEPPTPTLCALCAPTHAADNVTAATTASGHRRS